MKSLEKTIDRFAGRRVLVLGDLVADVFVYGEISRISREAPVLILNRKDTQLAPGGGANAIHNLWALGARPIPVGVVGDDSEGRQLLDYFRSIGIETGGIEVDPGYTTPSKTRILAGAPHSYRQQIVRLDAGGQTPSARTRNGLKRKLARLMRNADAALVSDYGYGLVTPELASGLRRSGKPVTLDSRFALMSFSGLSAATPNEPEVEEALGVRIGNDRTKLEWAGRTLLRRLKHDAVLITRGKEGMALFERGRRTEHIPIFGTDEIADVTGAGDTVIATFTLALAAGAGFVDAARLANFGGGLVVMKYGTRTISRDELLSALDRQS